MGQARLREGLAVSTHENRALFILFPHPVLCLERRSLAISGYRSCASAPVRLGFETIIQTESP